MTLAEPIAVTLELAAGLDELGIAPTFAAGPDETYLVAAHQFHAWIIGWRAHARALVTRGNYLIQLGITTRTDPDDADPGDEAPAPDVTESPNLP